MNTKYMQRHKFTIGIDIGGTNTVLGIVAGDGECIEKIKFQTKDVNRSRTSGRGG